MSIKSRKLIMVSIIGALYFPTTQLSAAELTPVANMNSVRQEMEIWTTYQISPFLRGSDISVFVKDGKVTLKGTVTEDVNKELAKAIAAGVKGVNSVDNQIEVDKNYKNAKPSQERSYAAIVDDAGITTAIKSKLLWSKFSDGVTINVDTYQGKVTLSGDVSNQASINSMTAMAKNTQGVLSVDSRLMIADAPMDKETNKYKEDEEKEDENEEKEGTLLADRWITTKVKSTYMYSSNVDSDDISVSTLDGVVLLEGKVKSGSERALAIELAKNIRGVKSVTSSKLLLL
ncbi:BON domain-containing protein [Pseudoalteromonas tunicata]|uniref:BON domain-containing protein n=1 Tax=Pseudoalteromonas tunicata TaxID=314281 RepID=UPI0027401AAE|nr:BON domain-containing protein [Pseudoalteromonas tunicata]MDP5212582.1 BON domain-containing protein [Pseudoalteromonas tunicata]